MNKSVNDCAKDMFVGLLSKKYPKLQLRKSLKGFAAAVAILQVSVDDNRRGWIAFGGFKQQHFRLYAGWTQTGQQPRQLQEWRQEADTVNALPAEGFVDLRDRWRMEPGAPERWLDISFPSPPAALQERVYQAHVQSPAFEVHVQQVYTRLQAVPRKPAPVLEQVRITAHQTERGLCGLWNHLLERQPLSAGELRALVEPPVRYAVELVDQYGIPLLSERLAPARTG